MYQVGQVYEYKVQATRTSIYSSIGYVAAGIEVAAILDRGTYWIHSFSPSFLPLVLYYIIPCSNASLIYTR